MFLCRFGWHTWEKWVVTHTYKIVSKHEFAGIEIEKPREVGTGEIQRRECTVCGKSEMRDQAHTI